MTDPTGTKSGARVLSCIQPTAAIHIGNYFGAIQNWVAMQHVYDCVYGVVDFHAMTAPYHREELAQNTYDMLIALMACGVDARASRLFVQSFVPEHTELCWILATVCGYGELARMTQFKDKSRQLRAKTESDAVDGAGVTAGLFLYPVLQAADILAYRPEVVPVGRDQKQHLELCRSIARRFNQQYRRAVFPEPATVFTKVPKVMSLTQPDRKMSKSLGEQNYVGIFDPPEVVRKKIRASVTDSGDVKAERTSPGVANLLTILEAAGESDRVIEMRDEYRLGRLKYVHLKDAVAEALIALFRPMRERREELHAKFKGPSSEWFCELSQNARSLAVETLEQARDAAGLIGFDCRFTKPTTAF